MKCTLSQSRIVARAADRGASLIVDSCAGTGKGVVLAAIVGTKCLDKVGHLSLASTGSAAMNSPNGWLNGVAIPATTVHQKLTKASLRGIWAFIKKCKWVEFSISIDEFAMLDASAFYELMQVVEDHLPARKNFRVAFYLLGDVYQVESVGPSLLAGRTFWQWYKRDRPVIYRLTELLRADAGDPFYPRLYAALYAVPRCGVAIGNILQERVLHPPPPSNDCRWLTQTNAVRHRINQRWFYGFVALRRSIFKLSQLDGVELAEALQDGELVSIPNAPSVCTFVSVAGEPIPGGQLAVGMELVCDKTVLDGDKYIVVKGERFVLRSFGGSEHPSPKRKRGDAALGPTFRGDKDAWIRAISVTHPDRGEHLFADPYEGGNCTIAPGAASTIAKSQGQTIKNRLVIDVGSCKTFGELVTICTRGTRVDNLYVRPFATAQLERLARIPLNTWVKKFIELPRE